MDEDNFFQANGTLPAGALGGFQVAGAYPDPAAFWCGVNAGGGTVGVYGESFPNTNPPNPGDRGSTLSPTSHIGILGRAENTGVLGQASDFAGVVGNALPDMPLISFGCVGGVRAANGEPRAMTGVSGDGVIGVFATGSRGDGVVANSDTGVGGSFSSNTRAQINLSTAQVGTLLPKTGSTGDIFARDEVTPGTTEVTVNLYVCVADGGFPSHPAPAVWKQVLLGVNLLIGGKQ